MTPRSLSSDTRDSIHKHNSQPIRKQQQQQQQPPDDGPSKKKRRRRPGPRLLSFAELAARQAARASKKRLKEERAKNNNPENLESSSARLLETTQAKRGNASSPLEKLPVELLERIFLYALETNFCRASPYLAAAVSSERIYRTLIRLAFFRNTLRGTTTSLVIGTGAAAAREKIAEALKPADYDTMQLDEASRAYLQATIMRCRWCTMQRIQAQLPTLMQMVIQQHWVGANIVISDPVQQASLDELLGVRGDGDGSEDVPAASGMLFRGTVGPNNGKSYYMSITPLVSVSINCAEANVRDVHRVLSLRVIPDYLLRGRCTSRSEKGHDTTTFSFAEQDIDLLEILRHEYGFDGTGHDVTFSKTALYAGMHTALETQNARALTSLLKIDEFFTRRRIETEPPPPNASSQGTTIGGGAYYSLPEDLFLRAVQLPLPNALDLFKLLLRCNAESMPADSSEITQWAMELSSTSGTDDDSSSTTTTSSSGSDTTEDKAHKAAAFGRWLLDFMIELPRVVEGARENPREEALFYYGAINAGTNKMGRRFLDEICGGGGRRRRDELTQSWIQEMSFDVSKTWSVN